MGGRTDRRVGKGWPSGCTKECDRGRVAGQYGAAVASYFIFLRWLFFLNIFLCVLVLVFLMTPQFIFPVTGFDRAVAGDTPNATVQLIASCSALYEQKDKNVSRNFMSHVSDILQGTVSRRRRRRYTGTPVHRYTGTPVHRYTGSDDSNGLAKVAQSVLIDRYAFSGNKFSFPVWLVASDSAKR